MSIDVSPEGQILTELARASVTQRESARARRMRLTVRSPGTVELVVPRGTAPAQREAFLRANLKWIAAMRAELEQRYHGDPSPVPSEIDLPAVAGRWEVVMRPMSRSETLRVQTDRIPMVVLNSACSVAALQQALRRWLVSEARSALGPWLRREGARLGLQPRRMQFRLQRSRWGSCSARGTISLNARALFLAPEVVRYLLVHELCHLRLMAHSPHYWALVERFEPDYRRLDACLSGSWARIPVWATPA